MIISAMKAKARNGADNINRSNTIAIKEYAHLESIRIRRRQSLAGSDFKRFRWYQYFMLHKHKYLHYSYRWSIIIEYGSRRNHEFVRAISEIRSMF